jgi:hypothetical protein
MYFLQKEKQKITVCLPNSEVLQLGLRPDGYEKQVLHTVIVICQVIVSILNCTPLQQTN